MHWHFNLNSDKWMWQCNRSFRIYIYLCQCVLIHTFVTLWLLYIWMSCLQLNASSAHYSNFTHILFCSQRDPEGVRRLRQAVLQRTGGPREDVDHSEWAQRWDGDLPGGSSHAASARSGLARLRQRVQARTGRKGQYREFNYNIGYINALEYFFYNGTSFYNSNVHLLVNFDVFFCRFFLSLLSKRPRPAVFCVVSRCPWPCTWIGWNRHFRSAAKTWSRPKGF